MVIIQNSNNYLITVGTTFISNEKCLSGSEKGDICFESTDWVV